MDSYKITIKSKLAEFSSILPLDLDADINSTWADLLKPYKINLDEEKYGMFCLKSNNRECVPFTQTLGEYRDFYKKKMKRYVIYIDVKNNKKTRKPGSGRKKKTAINNMAKIILPKRKGFLNHASNVPRVVTFNLSPMQNGSPEVVILDDEDDLNQSGKQKMFVAENQLTLPSSHQQHVPLTADDIYNNMHQRETANERYPEEDLESQLSQDSQFADMEEIKCKTVNRFVKDYSNGDMHKARNELKRLKHKKHFYKLSKIAPFCAGVLEHLFIDNY